MTTTALRTVTTRPAVLTAPGALPTAGRTATACCTDLARPAVDEGAAQDLARAFRALADPTRVRLLSLVASHAEQEACVCDLTEPVGLSQPTVSHHLKVLVEAGLLTREQRGRWAYYALVPGAVDDLAGLLSRSFAG
ncbi:ArsR/SmtB family transcription factor [Cellulomonas endophytica]|uniref:ArsR/SmtB family transcription factor n=1 Tax=Cellulomonas endophytica TaxID=2494735 RepID=UPI001010F322|nr:metalloregulator ArsR/SmtB family transcription factor [Cellulomonas endophytica]